MMQQDLTSGNINRGIWRLAVPMMIGNALHNGFNIVDMIFMGRIGPDAIAAVAMSGIILGVIFAGVLSLSMGIVAVVARGMGAKKRDVVENATIQSLILGAIGSVGIGALGYWSAPYLLKFLGASPEVAVLGVSYLQIVFVGLFTMFFSVVLGSALRAAGDAITPMKMLVGSTFLNILLDPFLIFGWWFFPQLGVAGAALATVSARGLGVLYLLWKCLNGQGVITLRVGGIRLDTGTMKAILSIGVFGSVQWILRNLSNFVLMKIVAVYGTAVVAAYGIGWRLQVVAMVPAFGLGNAVATLVGQNLGADKPDRAEQTARRATRAGAIIMAVLGVFYILLAGPLIRVFNTEAAVVQYGELFLYVVGGVFGFVAVSLVLGRALNGAGDTISPMVISGITLIGIRIPLALLGSHLWQVFGLFLGIAIPTILQGIATSIWFRRGNWKHKQIAQQSG